MEFRRVLFRFHRCGQRRSDRAAAGVAGGAGRVVIIPRQARAGVDGDEVTEQPIKALPFKGRVGWGWVSPPHKHQEREGQTPWKPRATHGSGKNNANENFDATRLTPNANSGNPCEANSSMARSSEGSILSATTYSIPPASTEKIGRASCRERVCKYV